MSSIALQAESLNVVNKATKEDLCKHSPWLLVIANEPATVL
jgi:hypothetical protein